MNYGEILTEFCISNTVDENPPVFSSTDRKTLKYKKHINDALAEIFSEEWESRKDILTFSTIVGQNSYDRPNGTICKGGVVVNGDTYQYSEADIYKSYKLVGSKIVLYPVPADVQTVKITYLILNSALSESGVPQIGLKLETDKPNIPETFHDVIVKKAELFYMRDKPNKNNAQAIKDIEKRINQLKDLDKGTYEASPIITLK